MVKKKRVCFVAGKSGGHIVPAITLAQKELHSEPNTTIVFYATNNVLDKRILRSHSQVFLCSYLPCARVPRGVRLFSWCRFFGEFLISFFRVLFSFLVFRPEKVVSTGGFVSVPVCLAAYFLRISIDVYELNVIPGKAVKFLSRFATHVYTCFEQTSEYIVHQAVKKKISYASYPVYASLPTYQLPSRQQARAGLGIPSDKKVLFVVGGSQGSMFLNESIFEFMCSCSQEQRGSLVLVHITGVKHEEALRLRYAEHGIQARVYGYYPQIDVLQVASDCMIIRGGAGALFESAYFHKPSIIIPLELGTDCHQVHNAYASQTAYPDLFSVWLQKDILQNKNKFFSDIFQMLS